jgi:hypothetical protein
VKAFATQFLIGKIINVDGNIAVFFVVACVCCTTEGARSGGQRGGKERNSTLAAACLRLMRARCSSRDDLAFDLIGSAAAVLLGGA